jgi:hypothetical protein
VPRIVPTQPRNCFHRSVFALGWTYRLEMATELCPAIRASVQAAHPDSPKRVRNVCRSEYRTNARTLLASSAARCWPQMLFGSTWPLRVPAVQTQSSSGFPVPFQRLSSTARTRGVIGSTLRAEAVLP